MTEYPITKRPTTLHCLVIRCLVFGAYLVFGIWLLVISLSAPAFADVPTKLDPLLNIVMQEPVAAIGAAKSLGLKAAVTGPTLVDVFLKTTDVGELIKIVEQWGGAVRTQAGDILTADVPLAFVPELAALDLVTYIEAARPVTPKLNASRAVVNIDDVQAGTGLPQAYTGSGVIVGVVDAGIDCLHADFQDSSGSPRILAYWDQGISGSGVAEITNSSGKEYTGTAISGGTCSSSPDSQSDGHGTHVAGIAVSKNSTYTGVATQAQLVAVKYSVTDASSAGTFATQIVDAVNYIFRKAQAQSPKKPAVVNLSIGTSLGAHDDTSLFEQGLNALTQASGSDKVGRAIVCAEGNENLMSSDSEVATYAGIHATVSTSNESKAFDFAIRDSALLNTCSSCFGEAIADIWLTSASSCSVQLDAYPVSSKSSALIDMSAVAKGSSTPSSANTDGKIQISLDFTDSSNANNGKQHALARITKVSGASVDPTSYSFDLLFSGTCSGNVWLYPDFTKKIGFRKVAALPSASNSRGYSYVSGDSNSTTTIPATASKCISVGSFIARGTWTDLNGTSHDQTSTSLGTGGTVSGISLFSSLGPTADGRVKPDLVAPGEPIISTSASTISSVAVPTTSKGNSTHHKLEGTSMAAPHVTGTIALMLQRNGCLTPTQIKTALKDTATKDSFTGSSLPDNTWGAGKLDALAAAQAVTAASCVPDNSSENGAGSSLGGKSSGSSDTQGGGGCSLVVYGKYPMARTNTQYPIPNTQIPNTK